MFEKLVAKLGGQGSARNVKQALQSTLPKGVLSVLTERSKVRVATPRRGQEKDKRQPEDKNSTRGEEEERRTGAASQSKNSKPLGTIPQMGSQARPVNSAPPACSTARAQYLTEEDTNLAKCVQTIEGSQE